MEKPSRFRTADEVCLYVDDQLTETLPSDWKCQRKGSKLEWSIEPKVRAQNSLEDDYILEVSGDYRFFILYFGNSSSGIDGVGQAMLTAVVLTSEALSSCSLASAVKRMIEQRDYYKLNMWSLT
ncbi:MAG TPA: hypothetical protein DCE44_05420 [Verrucomicrobiales bacterium]|nr:hypothetical protein [Verrucomicrobiales bacterium]